MDSPRSPRASLALRLYHLVLPALALGIVSSALILRFTRASMLDVLGDDYIRTARSKGMGEFRVVMKHAFKNALIPVLTVLGLTAALLVSGAVVTETVFGLPGVGNLVVSAVLRRDYPVIQGALLMVAGLYVIINFLIDMLYLAVDPGCVTDGCRRFRRRSRATFVCASSSPPDGDGSGSSFSASWRAGDPGSLDRALIRPTGCRS